MEDGTESLKFDKLFKLSTLCMKMNGSHPSVSRNFFWVFRFLFVIGIFITHFSFILNSIIFYDIYQEDATEHVCRSGALLIIAFIITMKYFSLIWYRKENLSLIKYIDVDYEYCASLSKEEQDIINNFANRGAWVCKLWFFTPFVTGGVFTVRPIIIIIYRYLVGEYHIEKIFEYTYPSGLDERRDELVVFIPMLVLNICFVLCAASMYAGFDSLGPTFMLHACGQLEVAKYKISKLFSNELIDPNVLRHEVRYIIIHLQNIYGFVDCMKKTLLAWYEISLKVTTVSIPFTALAIVESLKRGIVNVEFISMEFVCLAHMFVPCYYGGLLLETGENIFSAIYASGWETLAILDVRMKLLFMLMRANRPLAVRSVFRVISLDTFADMCRQSYAIFNFINATN